MWYCTIRLLSTCLPWSTVGIAIEGQDDDGQLGSSTVKMDDEGHIVISKPRISGKIQLTYFEGEEKEKLVEVDADAYMAELRGQVPHTVIQYLHLHCISVVGLYSYRIPVGMNDIVIAAPPCVGAFSMY